jgi:hypothetical protein
MLLDEIRDGEKALRENWDELSLNGRSSFSHFPFFTDPKFLELTPIQQKLILAMSLKDVYGFRLYDAYRFATGVTGTNKGDIQKCSSMLKATGVKHFLDKLDMIRLESLGFSTLGIIQAEAEISYSDITNYMDEDNCIIGELKALPENVRRAIKSFEVLEHLDKQGEPVRKVKVTLWDKGASLHRLEKIKGMHIDNVVSVSNVTNINAEMTPTDASKIYQDMLSGSSD